MATHDIPMVEKEPGKFEPKDQQVTKVVTGEVTKVKKNAFDKAKDVFVNEDTKKVRTYLIYDVLIPALKDTFVNLITKGAQMLFYGDVRNNNTYSSGTTTYVNYAGYGSNVQRQQKQQNNYGNRSVYEYQKIKFSTRQDAENTLSALIERIQEFGQASVADLYGFTGQEDTFTDHNYGWYDLSSATTKRVSDGYILDLPRVTRLD